MTIDSLRILRNVEECFIVKCELVVMRPVGRQGLQPDYWEFVGVIHLNRFSLAPPPIPAPIIDPSDAPVSNGPQNPPLRPPANPLMTPTNAAVVATVAPSDTVSVAIREVLAEAATSP